MRRWIKITLIIASSLVIVAVAAYLYIFHLGGLEAIINAKISSLTNQQYLLDVRVKEIKGSYLSNVILEDIEVYFDDSLRRYRLLKIPRVEASYSFSNIWDYRFIFDYLTIDSAELTLVRDTGRGWVVPDFRPKDTSTGLSGGLPEFSVANLNLRNVSVRLQKPDDTVAFDDIFISLAFKGEEDTYSIDLEQFEFTSNMRKLALDAAGGMVTYSGDRLLFQDLSLVSGQSRVRLSGNVDLQQPLAGYVSFAGDNLDLADITTYIGPKLSGIVDVNGDLSFVGASLDGSVDIGGTFLLADFDNLFVDFRYADRYLGFDTLYGTVLGNCAIDGSGYIDFTGPMESYEMRAAIKQFNLENLIDNTFQSDLSGNITLAGESFRNATLLLDIHADLYESSFDEYPIQRGVGDILITTESLVFPDRFWVKYFENDFYATGTIEYSDEIDLSLDIDLNNLDRYRGKLFIDQPGGRGKATATLTGMTSDPDLKGDFRSDSVWIYGLYSDSLYSTVDIDRFLSRKLGTVEVDFYRGSAWDTPYDTGYASLRIDSNLVFFDTAYVYNPYTRLTTEGRYDYETVPGELRVDTLTLDLFGQTFHNRDRIDIDVDTLGFNFVQAVIGDSRASLAVNGRANYDESMDLMLQLESLPIKPWKNLWAESLMVDGLLSAEVSLQGSFMKPEFILDAHVDSLVYRNLLLGEVGASVTYGDRLMNIENFQIISGYGDYRAEGSFYVDLAFTTDSLERFPDLPMNISIAAVDSRFDLVSLLQPSVEELKGDFFADFILSGTPHEPHLEGEAFMIGAELKYFDLEDRFYSDSIAVHMADNRIIIDELEAYVPEDPDNISGGRASIFISGAVTVKSLDNLYYSLDISIPDKLPFRYELDDIEGEVTGRLYVEGDTPPLVTGDIKLVSMRYLVNFAEPDEGSPIMAALEGENTWDLSIDIEIPSNYWIKNDDIDAEFAGEVTLMREDGVYSFIGELEVLRGRGFLFDKIFQLETGGTVVFEGGETFNPRLDIEAVTHIAGSRGTDQGTDEIEQLELGILITGTLEEPEINVSADSDVGSREDILPLIVANQYASENGSTTTSFESRVANLVSAQLSQIGSRQLGRLGVETFEIDPSYSGELDPLNTRVTLGFYTSPNLYLYGRSALSGQSRQEVGFEYRFNKSVILEGLRDEDELYHLNLKLNLEF